MQELSVESETDIENQITLLSQKLERIRINKLIKYIEQKEQITTLQKENENLKK